MAERRTTSQEKQFDKLKQIAGLIRSLTYAEMMKLSYIIGEIDPKDLLGVADKLLGKDDESTVLFS